MDQWIDTFFCELESRLILQPTSPGDHLWTAAVYVLTLSLDIAGGVGHEILARSAAVWQMYAPV